MPGDERPDLPGRRSIEPISTSRPICRHCRSPGTTSGEHHAHWLKFTCKRIQHHTQNLQSDDAEKSFVARFAEDNRGVCLTQRNGEMTFTDRSRHHRSVGERDRYSALRFQSDVTPRRVRKKRVGRATVDEKADGRASSIRPPGNTLHEGESHAASYFTPFPVCGGKGSPTPGDSRSPRSAPQHRLRPQRRSPLALRLPATARRPDVDRRPRRVPRECFLHNVSSWPLRIVVENR